MSGSVVDEFQRLPAAILWDGTVPIPLFVVTRMSLSERYALPAVGASTFRSSVDNVTETVSLSALLIGTQRFAWKEALELMAASSKRGGALGAWSGGKLGGLVLVTRMLVRTNMQVTSLSFTASAQRQECFDVSLELQHVPVPGPLDALLDVGSVALSTVLGFL